MDPEEIERRQFTTRLHGFDREEVTSFLHTVVAHYRALQQRLPSAPGTAGERFSELGQHIAAVLDAAHHAAERVVAEAAEAAEEIRAEGRRALELADREAADLRSAARREADQLMEATRREAAARIAAAERRTEDLVAVQQIVRQRLHEAQELLRAPLLALQAAPSAGVPAGDDPKSEDRRDAAAPVAPSPPDIEIVLPDDAPEAQGPGVTTVCDEPPRGAEPGLPPTGATRSDPEPRTIVFADDDADLAQIVETHLTRLGYVVVVAVDGSTALQEIRRRRPALAILDWIMPGIQGPAVCEQIRQDPDTASIPILVLTSRTAEEQVADAFRHGADDYMTKPFGLEELEQAARRLVAGGESAARGHLAAG